MTALYPTLLAGKRAGAAEAALRTIVAASAEGYPFLTNVDLDQPIGSLNAETHAELTSRALSENWELETISPSSTRSIRVIRAADAGAGRLLYSLGS